MGAGGVTDLGVAAGPPDPVWTIAAVLTEAGERERARCPQGAEMGYCGPSLFGRVPWPWSSLASGH